MSLKAKLKDLGLRRSIIAPYARLLEKADIECDSQELLEELIEDFVEEVLKEE